MHSMIKVLILFRRMVIYDIMSASELEQAEPVHSERRMSITSCACDIITAKLFLTKEI